MKYRILNRLRDVIEKRWVKRKHRKPFREWYYPVMLLLMAGPIFIMVTGMFGVRYDTTTGEMEWHTGWGEMMGNPGPDRVNPMLQFPRETYYIMILGYFVAIAMISYFYWQYCLRKWQILAQQGEL